MTTKPEHGQWSLSWSLEYFLAWEGYTFEALHWHIVINFIFSWKRYCLFCLFKILITITKLIILISRMVSSIDTVIKLILLSKLDHDMSRQASWYNYIRRPWCDGVLFSVGGYIFSTPDQMFWNCEWETNTCCLNLMCLKQCIWWVFLNVLHLTYFVIKI